MRPESNSTLAAASGASGLRHWNSPIPYLFGGLGLMLGLIAMALLILACSFKKSPSNSPADDQAEEKAAKQAMSSMQLEMEPKIVVIMAGDENPTYLAKPVVSSTRHCEQV